MLGIKEDIEWVLKIKLKNKNKGILAIWEKAKRLKIRIEEIERVILLVSNILKSIEGHSRLAKWRSINITSITSAGQEFREAFN